MKTACESLLKRLQLGEVNTINIYTIKRGTSQDLEKKYLLEFATITGDPKRVILELIVNFIGSKLENISKTKDFFDYNCDFSYCFHIDSDKISGFEKVLNKMNQFSNLPRITELNKHTTAIIIEILIEEDRYLFFQKIDTSQVLKKGFFNIILSEGSFNRIVELEKQLEIKPYFDFMYLSPKDKFLVFLKPNFERIFDFNDFYLQATTTSFGLMNKNKITVSQNVSDLVYKRKSSMSQLTKLYMNGLLDTISIKLKDYKDFHPSFVIEKNGNIQIDTEQKLEDFLNIVSKNCVEEVSSKEKFISKNKSKVV